MCFFITSCAGRNDDKGVHIKFAVCLFPIFVIKERGECRFCKSFLNDIYRYCKCFVYSCFLIVKKDNSGIILTRLSVLPLHEL